LISLSTLVSFRWTVPLSRSLGTNQQGAEIGLLPLTNSQPVCLFLLSANRGKRIAVTNKQNRLLAENGKLSAMNVNGLSAISSMQQERHGNEKATCIAYAAAAM
jgi:hypothetical protein